MKFEEVLKRITGISCPIFGLSWQAPEAECLVARRMLAFLEDRRVLYVDSEMEVPIHCVRSIIKIREVLTSELSTLKSDSEIAQSLRAMRLACRRFLKQVGPLDGVYVQFGADYRHYASWSFYSWVGQLRNTFGTQIARIASTYGIDIEDDLGTILPEIDEEGKEGDSMV